MDYAMLKNLHGGLEISQRSLKVPFPDKKQDILTKIDSEIEGTKKQEESLFRAYLYWIPHNYWSVKSEFQFEQYSRNENATSFTSPSRIQNLRIPFEISLFHPSGLLSKLTFTVVDQNINRKIQQEPLILKQSNDTFFLLDYNIGYRLPNRRGLISFEAKNLLDSAFDFRNINFFQSEPIGSRFIPDRTFFLHATLNY